MQIIGPAVPMGLRRGENPPLDVVALGAVNVDYLIREQEAEGISGLRAVEPGTGVLIDSAGHLESLLGELAGRPHELR